MNLKSRLELLTYYIRAAQESAGRAEESITTESSREHLSDLQNYLHILNLKLTELQGEIS